MDKENEKEGGRMQGFVKQEDRSLIDVKKSLNLGRPTYFDNCAFFTALASFLLQFCLIHLSLVSLAFFPTYFTFLSAVRVHFCTR